MFRHASEAGARCPYCKSELPIMFEQARRLAEGKEVWLFCPIYTRLVLAEGFARVSIRELATG